jgi:hypothetical protein
LGKIARCNAFQVLSCNAKFSAFEENTKTLHAGSIQDLKDKVTRSIQSAFSQDGRLENLRSTISSSSTSQDIYVGLTLLSLDTTSSNVVASLLSIPATVASYSLPKLLDLNRVVWS